MPNRITHSPCRPAFLPLAHRFAQSFWKEAPPLCAPTAQPSLLHVARQIDGAVRDRVSVVGRRVHALGPVRDAPRANAQEMSVGEVKELSSDLMVPGVAMVVTMPVTDTVGLVTKEDVHAGSCWIAVNGIPLQASKFDFRSNFWGTRRSLDFHVRIPPEHLDEAGLGLLYPGDELSLAKMQETDALEFKRQFAEAKRRQELLREAEGVEAEGVEADTNEALGTGEAVSGSADETADEAKALKAQLDLQYPSLKQRPSDS